MLCHVKNVFLVRTFTERAGVRFNDGLKLIYEVKLACTRSYFGSGVDIFLSVDIFCNVRRTICGNTGMKQHYNGEG